MTTATTTSIPRDHPWLGLVGWVALAFVAAAIGAAATADAPGFYAQLDRPTWAPPAWLFGPVWSLLYVLMGVAAWLVWRRHGMAGARWPLALFLAQLVANALWSWLFFGWQLGALAFAGVLLLAVLVAATGIAFGRVHRLAAALFAPYLAWVAFASALTFSVWQRNPGLLA